MMWCSITQQGCLFPEILTRLLKMIHRARCEQLHVGTIFSLCHPGEGSVRLLTDERRQHHWCLHPASGPRSPSSMCCGLWIISSYRVRISGKRHCCWGETHYLTKKLHWSNCKPDLSSCFNLFWSESEFVFVQRLQMWRSLTLLV